jgi:hypothetical protein
MEEVMMAQVVNGIGINIEDIKFSPILSFKGVMGFFRRQSQQSSDVYVEMRGDGFSRIFNGLVQNRSGVIIILHSLTIDGHPAEVNGLGISSTTGGGLGFDMANFPEYVFNEPRKRIALTAYYHTQDSTGRVYKYTAYGKQVPRIPGGRAKFNVEFKGRPTIQEI